jgi:hypothetical protein
MASILCQEQTYAFCTSLDNLLFPERAGGNVVECACLIGLPKFKVLV